MVNWTGTKAGAKQWWKTYTTAQSLREYAALRQIDKYDELLTGKMLTVAIGLESDSRKLYDLTFKFMNNLRKINKQARVEVATVQKMSMKARDQLIRQKFAENKANISMIAQMTSLIKDVTTKQNALYRETSLVTHALARELGLASAVSKTERTPVLARRMRQVGTFPTVR